MSAPGSNGHTPNGHDPKNANGYGGPNGAPSARGPETNGKPGAPAVLNTQERVTNQSVMLTLNYQFH